MKIKKRLLAIHHFIVSIILMTKGFDKIQHHHSFIGWTILLLGIIVLIYFIFLKVSKKSHTTIGLVVHFFESIALFFTTYVYFQEGKTFLPYITLIAGIGFLIITLLHITRHKENNTETKI